MFPLALFIGIYSYVIFALGIVHLLYPVSIGLVTLGVIIALIMWFRNDLKGIWKKRKSSLSSLKDLSSFSKIVLFLTACIWVTNFIGVLAPVTAFDALWYHLTIPKIFLQNHAVTFIEGGLYKYSLMPKLIDMLFVPSVLMNSGVGASLTHFMFGLLTAIALFMVSRRFLSLPLSLLVVLIFSSNLVVMWESTTAYIDLGRAFFELMALWGLLKYLDEKKELWFVESAINAGFAITAKLLAAGSLVIFVVLLLSIYKNNIAKGQKQSFRYVLIALAVPIPYFVFSYFSSGNPIYPFFTDFYPVGVKEQWLSLTTIIRDFWNVFVTGSDPINPIYLIILPLIPLIITKLKGHEKLIALYCLVALIAWYLTPHTGGGRFMLAYLPIFSLFVGLVLKYTKQLSLVRISAGLILLFAVISIGYRSIAQLRYFPVVFGKETHEEFLMKHLNFDFGDYYDGGGQVASIVGDEKVLVFGIHNLFYADFPFVHESAIQPGEEFSYILASDSFQLPERFSYWTPIYSDNITRTVLYHQGGNRWVY